MSIISTMYSKQDFAPEILKAAENISLRDLLESPAYQSWMISALSNGSRFRLQFQGADSDFDSWTQFQVDRALAGIPSEQKQICFDSINEIIKNNRRERMNYAKR